MKRIAFGCACSLGLVLGSVVAATAQAQPAPQESTKPDSKPSGSAPGLPGPIGGFSERTKRQQEISDQELKKVLKGMKDATDKTNAALKHLDESLAADRAKQKWPAIVTTPIAVLVCVILFAPFFFVIVILKKKFAASGTK